MASLFIHWNPDPELFTLFGFPIRYYGLLFLIGILLSLKAIRHLFKQEAIPENEVDALTVYGMIGIVIGARLGHCLFYEPSYYLAHPLEMLLPISIQEDGSISYIGYRGLASHGGALGLLLALLFFARKTGHSKLLILDLIAIATGLAAGFIRLANFMNSEIIGSPTNQSWGVIFEQVDKFPRHPAQLYEALSYFIIFGILWYLYHKKRERYPHGSFFGIALILIFSARLMLEFTKQNQVSFEEGMTLNMGQLLSFPYILLGIGCMVYARRITNFQK